MTWAAIGHFLRDIAPVVAMFTSLFLLWQGQRDRRRLREEQQAVQAARVVLAVGADAQWDPARGSGALHSLAVQLVNDSDRTVVIDSLTLVSPGRTTEPLAPELTTWGPKALFAKERLEVPIPWEKWSTYSLDRSSDFIMVLFHDSDGRRWVKRSDTGDFKLYHPPVNHWQALVQELDRRSRIVRCMLAALERCAIWSATRSRGRVPWTLRALRALWGYWRGGECDPWLLSPDAPALARYDEIGYDETRFSQRTPA